MVWNGAADTHMKRLERVQHRFLMWLGSRCRAVDVSLQYEDLLRSFRVKTLAARRAQHDILFIRYVHHHEIDSSFLVERIPIAVPKRSLRKIEGFHVPFGRTSTVKNSIFSRAPSTCNRFLKNRYVDIWTDHAMRFNPRPAGGGGKGPPCGFSQIAPEVLGISL